MINIALLDPDPLRQQQLHQQLQQIPDVCLQATDADNLQVALVDIDNAEQFLQSCIARHTPPVLLLVNDAEQQEEAILALLAQGCRGFINPQTEAALLEKAIKTLAAGEGWISRRVLGQIMERKLRWQQQSELES